MILKFRPRATDGLTEMVREQRQDEWWATTGKRIQIAMAYQLTHWIEQMFEKMGDEPFVRHKLEKALEEIRQKWLLHNAPFAAMDPSYYTFQLEMRPSYSLHFRLKPKITFSRHINLLFEGRAPVVIHHPSSPFYQSGLRSWAQHEKRCALMPSTPKGHS